jgi:hypothetical protein
MNLLKMLFGSRKPALNKPAVSSRFVVITYLIYIIIWESMVLGGFGYVVFGLGKSGWWMLLAVFMSSSAYKPENWRQLNGFLTLKEDKQ